VCFGGFTTPGPRRNTTSTYSTGCCGRRACSDPLVGLSAAVCRWGRGGGTPSPAPSESANAGGDPPRVGMTCRGGLRRSRSGVANGSRGGCALPHAPLAARRCGSEERFSAVGFHSCFCPPAVSGIAPQSSAPGWVRSRVPHALSPTIRSHPTSSVFGRVLGVPSTGGRAPRMGVSVSGTALVGVETPFSGCHPWRWRMCEEGVDGPFDSPARTPLVRGAIDFSMREPVQWP